MTYLAMTKQDIYNYASDQKRVFGNSGKFRKLDLKKSETSVLVSINPVYS